MNPQKVYVITSVDGPTKIGISHQPEHRRMHLQSQFKDRFLQLVHVADTEGLPALMVERKAHDLLAQVRVHGEWFDVDADRAIAAIDEAISAVRAAGVPPISQPKQKTTTLTTWHLRVTLESSAMRRVEQLARDEKRSLSNLAGLLLEQYQRDKEPIREAD